MDLKNEWPVLVAILGVSVGILGMVSIITIPFLKTYPLTMVVVSGSFLFYKGQHPVLWKYAFFILNAVWLVLTWNLKIT